MELCLTLPSLHSEWRMMAFHFNDLGGGLPPLDNPLHATALTQERFSWRDMEATRMTSDITAMTRQR